MEYLYLFELWINQQRATLLLKTEGRLRLFYRSKAVGNWRFLNVAVTQTVLLLNSNFHPVFTFLFNQFRLIFARVRTHIFL